jgi:hypothetical protein
MIRLWVILVLWVLQAALIALFVSADWVRGQVDSERSRVADYLGQETAGAIAHQTQATYRRIAVDSGLQRLTYRALIPWHVPDKPVTGLEDMAPWLFAWMEARLDAFWWLVYQAVFRLMQMGVWLPYLGVFLVAGLGDGLMVRAVTKTAIGDHTSALRYDLGIQSLLALVAAPLVYLSLPLSVPPVVIPLWGGLACAALLLTGASLQKRL